MTSVITHWWNGCDYCHLLLLNQLLLAPIVTSGLVVGFSGGSISYWHQGTLLASLPALSCSVQCSVIHGLHCRGACGVQCFGIHCVQCSLILCVQCCGIHVVQCSVIHGVQCSVINGVLCSGRVLAEVGVTSHRVA